MTLKNLVCVAGALACAVIVAACGSSSSSSTSTSSNAAATSSTSSSTSPTAATTSTAASGTSPFTNYAQTLAPPNFTPPSKPVKVALLLASTQLPSELSVKIGVEDAAKKDNAQVTYFDAGGFENSVTAQVNQMETAIGQHPQAIIVVPASPVALNPEIAAATKAGIAVLADLIPPSSTDVKFSFVDPLASDAAKAVDALAAKNGGKGELYALYGGAGSTVNTLFASGANAELKKYPNMKVVFTKDFPAFSESDAQSATEDALVRDPNVTGIITNDDGLGEGAARALKAAGKSAVPISGLGPSDQQEIDGIRSGAIAIGVTPPFYESGYQSLQWALAIVAGQKPASVLDPIPALVVNSQNIDQALSSGIMFQALAPSAIGCGPGQGKQC